jgi:hypothetical protein
MSRYKVRCGDRSAAHILEWQYRNGRPIRKRGSGTNRRRGTFFGRRFVILANAHTMNTDRPTDVLDRLLTQIFKTETELVADFIAHVARDHDATGIGKSLQPRRNVDPVTKNIIVVDDDVADIDADTELNIGFGWHVAVPLDHAALDIDGTAHRIDNADEFHQHPVARGFDDATSVFGDHGIDPVLCDEP